MRISGSNGSNAGYATFRGSVKGMATHSIRQFPLHLPSRASSCAITFQLDSTQCHDQTTVHKEEVYFEHTTLFHCSLNYRSEENVPFPSVSKDCCAVLRTLTDDVPTKQPVGYVTNFMKQRHSLQAGSVYVSQKFAAFWEYET
jgi:hypothetical protein